MATVSIRRRLMSGLYEPVSILLFLAVWELAPHLGGLLKVFIAPPTEVLRVIVEMAWSHELFAHIGVSLGRALSGLAAAAVVGIPLGFSLGGGFASFQRLMRPVLGFLGNVNPFALFPLFILLFGIGELSKGAMNYQIPGIYAGALVVTVLGYCLHRGLVSVETRLFPRLSTPVGDLTAGPPLRRLRVAPVIACGAALAIWLALGAGEVHRLQVRDRMAGTEEESGQR
jgi:ABC-type nitrate/sulfonate/bicarbonate transport system permease component